MKNRKIVREMGKILNVNKQDIPKTLKRFKDEIEEMESKM